MRSWIVAGVILAALVATGAAYSSFWGGVRLETADARRSDIRQFVDEQGQTRLPRVHVITMPYNGRVEAIDLREGTPVRAGQVVARVVSLDRDLKVEEALAAVDRLDAQISENDDTSVEATLLKQSLSFVQSTDRTVEAAGERVRAGEARLIFADKNLKRVRTLAETGAKVEEDLNEAEMAQVEASVNYQQDALVKSAMESIQAATALMPTMVRQYIERKQLARAVLEKEKAQADVRLREAQRDRGRGEMKSPVNGIVLDRFESNERQVNAGTTLLSIGDLAELEVEVDVLSEDVVYIKPGQRVDLFSPGIGRAAAAGTVARIFPAGFTKVSSLGVEQQRVKVIVRFVPSVRARLRREHYLGVGYRVRARIYTHERSQALVIPRSAIFRGPSGGWQVFAVRDGAARLVELKVGLLNDELVEILAGVEVGDPVILAPESNLVDGTRVRSVRPE